MRKKVEIEDSWLGTCSLEESGAQDARWSLGNWLVEATPGSGEGGAPVLLRALHFATPGGSKPSEVGLEGERK